MGLASASCTACAHTERTFRHRSHPTGTEQGRQTTDMASSTKDTGQAHHALWGGIGAILLAAMIAGLIAYYQSAQPPSALFWLSVAVGAIGAYAVTAPFLGLPLPKTRSRPFWQPQRTPSVVAATPPPAPALLEPRYDLLRSPYGDQFFDHRIGVRNTSRSQTATHVRLNLVAMEPLPRNQQFVGPVIPCPVPLPGGGDVTIGITIPPSQEELWKIGSSMAGNDGGLSLAGFAVRPERADLFTWQFEPDERCRVSYQIVADQAPDGIPFSVVLTAVNGLLQCVLEG